MEHTGFTRRRLLAASGVAAALVWVPAFRVEAADDTPSGFPSSVPLYRQAFENWAHAIVVDDLLTCAPETADQVALVATWAAAHGWRVRARGKMHGWSPTTVTSGMTAASKVILVDTTQHLNGIHVTPGTPGSVTAQTGALLDDIHAAIEAAGLGIVGIPAPGDLTVGGALAINAHGASVPSHGEQQPVGGTYGTLSNLVVSFTAVVWDPASNAFTLRTFGRADPEAKAFLVHLGRAFLTEVTLRLAPAARLRCVSRTDITGAELFASPGSKGRTFAGFMEDAGRLEAIWFPFTDKPWLKVWSVSPAKPASSRAVTSPYNYPFSDQIPRPLALLAEELVQGNVSATPEFGALSYDVSANGLTATRSSDLWGPAKDVQLYVRPTTLLLTQQCWAVVTKRANVQRVVSEFTATCQAITAAYAARGEYPVNGPIEIRVSGLDHPEDVGVAGAEAPILSSATPEPGHPEWDVAVWCGILTFAGTASSFAAFRELETWMYANYHGSYAAVRPEWSKAWAFTDDASWADPTVLDHAIPNAFRRGRTTANGWNAAVATLHAADPHRVFSNPFLDRLLH